MQAPKELTTSPLISVRMWITQEGKFSWEIQSQSEPTLLDLLGMSTLFQHSVMAGITKGRIITIN